MNNRYFVDGIIFKLLLKIFYKDVSFLHNALVFVLSDLRLYIVKFEKCTDGLMEEKMDLRTGYLKI